MHLLWFVPTFPDQSRLGDASTLVSPSLEHLTRVAQADLGIGCEAQQHVCVIGQKGPGGKLVVAPALGHRRRLIREIDSAK